MYCRSMIAIYEKKGSFAPCHLVMFLFARISFFILFIFTAYSFKSTCQCYRISCLLPLLADNFSVSRHQGKKLGTEKNSMDNFFLI